MINLSKYSLTAAEQDAIKLLLVGVGINPTLEQLWQIMDYVWDQCGCDNLNPDPDKLAKFYGHPVWLLNGMFIEQHGISMGHRHAITDAVANLNPKSVIDFGGGFGTLARLLAVALPYADISICEPYPPRHGVQSCQPFPNIHFVPKLSRQSVDVLVSTDVLEHVLDPCSLLVAMVNAVRPDGHLLIANCFFPVIRCHLPSTFHLRYSFGILCESLGLSLIGPCEGSHATIYKRTHVLEPNWTQLRSIERRSKRLFRLREWKGRYLSPWRHRIDLALTHPLHYPRKFIHAMRAEN